MQEPARRASPGAVLMVVGGIVYLVAGVLQWGRATVSAGGQSIPVKITGGGLAFVLGGLLVVLGLLILAVKARGARLVFAILGILAALAAGGAALYFAVSRAPFEATWASACADRVSCGGGSSSSTIEKQLKSAIAKGQVRFDASRKLGLYIGLAGGVLGLIGGAVSIGSRGAPTAPTPPPPPPGVAVWPAQPPYAPVPPPVAPEGGVPPPSPPSAPSAPSPPPPPPSPPPPPPGEYSG
jgi:hypothetical protein